MRRGRPELLDGSLVLGCGSPHVADEAIRWPPTVQLEHDAPVMRRCNDGGRCDAVAASTAMFDGEAPVSQTDWDAGRVSDRPCRHWFQLVNGIAARLGQRLRKINTQRQSVA